MHSGLNLFDRTNSERRLREQKSEQFAKQCERYQIYMQSLVTVACTPVTKTNDHGQTEIAQNNPQACQEALEALQNLTKECLPSIQRR